jgi:hypothetical protein
MPAEVLGAVGRSMNVTLIRPADQDESARADARPDGLAAAAEALRRAARATSPYALVTAAEADGTESPGPVEQNFYLGPLRATRPHRVAFVPATR